MIASSGAVIFLFIVGMGISMMVPCKTQGFGMQKGRLNHGSE